MASMIRWALSPARSRVRGFAAASIYRDSSWPTNQSALVGGILRPPPAHAKGAPGGALRKPSSSAPLRRGGLGRGRRSRGRRVVELLLRAEQRVEHLLA